MQANRELLKDGIIWMALTYYEAPKLKSSDPPKTWRKLLPHMDLLRKYRLACLNLLSQAWLR